MWRAGLTATVLLTLVGARPGVASAAESPSVRAEVPVTAMDRGPFGPANNSPTLAADPTDARFVVLANRLDAPDFSCALQVSGNKGRTWLQAQPAPKLPEGVEKCYAPEIVFGRDGVLYYLFVGLAGAGNEPVGVFLTSSRDRAFTFSRPRRVLGPLNFAVRMAMDPDVGARGRLHLVWLHATSDPPLGGFGPPPNPILAAHSDDGGRTFSKPVQVSDVSRDRVVAPALAVGTDSKVHVAYYDLQDDAVDYQGLEGPIWDGMWSLVLATSGDGGRTFGRGVSISDVTPPERVMLIFTMAPPALLAGKNNRICAAWPDARNGDPDVLLRCSPDAKRFERVHRLNDDRLGNQRTQYLPRLSMSDDGRLDAIFYDRRRDPENVLNDVYYVYSLDGGRQFSRNLRLTQRSFESRVGQQYVHPAAAGQYEFGSRLALLSGESRVLAAWTDTRNSLLLPTSTGQDIFATEIVFPTGDDPLSRWLMVPVAGAVAGAALLAVSRKRRRRVQRTVSA